MWLVQEEKDLPKVLKGWGDWTGAGVKARKDRRPLRKSWRQCEPPDVPHGNQGETMVYATY